MNIAWFIFIAFLFLMAQSYLFRKWGLTRLTYSRTFSKESVFAGEEFEMLDEISNRKGLPIPWLRLESRIDPGLQFIRRQDSIKDEASEGYHKTLFSLFPYQKVTRRHRIKGLKRGVYHLENVSITLGDLIGLANAHESFHSEAMVLIYPKLVPIDQLPLPAHSLLGEITVKRWLMEDPFIRAGVRDYVNGDPLRSLNWKATARTGRLQVSKNDYTADFHLMIYLNLDETDDLWMPILNKPLAELKISYAATLATYLITKGISTGFGANSDFVPPFGSAPAQGRASVRIEPNHRQQQLTRLYDAMAKLSLDRSMSFPQFLNEDIGSRTNTDILIITSHVSEAWEERIRSIKNQGNEVHLLMISDSLNKGQEDKKEGEIKLGIN
ncbi:DUF58 domain-containing protein [Pullulanibacillus sp. KACC 23026]|uniref:DUF58 domain-containing protein n=1 Tax=Pullulanibacillus sp. KACC 23026 TaxID=3028315 RepID=UPI0023B1924C|nr:DUF58 domain-containing protein [Pullulanibacillus sp. KACC 23026]WEG11893.1 DUF58 domain-containing protein [Pullulanibacillus sp. KACC 23026]